MQANSLNNTEHPENFLLKGFGFLLSSISIALALCFLVCAFVIFLVCAIALAFALALCFLVCVSVCVLMVGALSLVSALSSFALTLLLIPVYWLASFFADLDMLCRNLTPKTSWTEIIANLSYNFFFTPLIMLCKCVSNLIRNQSLRDEEKTGKQFSYLEKVCKNVFSPFLDETNFKKKVIREAKNQVNIDYKHIMLSLTFWFSVTALVLVLEGFFPASILPSGVFADAIAGLSTPALAGCAAGTVLLLGLLTTLIIVSCNKPSSKENLLHLRVTPEQYTSDVPPPSYFQHLNNVGPLKRVLYHNPLALCSPPLLRGP